MKVKFYEISDLGHCNDTPKIGLYEYFDLLWSELNTSVANVGRLADRQLGLSPRELLFDDLNTFDLYATSTRPTLTILMLSHRSLRHVQSRAFWCLSNIKLCVPSQAHYLLLASQLKPFELGRSSSSSTRWKSRQGRDSFAREAKVQGLKSRAAFKLLEVGIATCIDGSIADGCSLMESLDRRKI